MLQLMGLQRVGHDLVNEQKGSKMHPLLEASFSETHPGTGAGGQSKCEEEVYTGSRVT